LVKNNFPESLFSVVKPFVLSLSRHERLDAVGPKFFRPPFDKLRANGKISPIHIGKLLPAISLNNDHEAHGGHEKLNPSCLSCASWF